MRTLKFRAWDEDYEKFLYTPEDGSYTVIPDPPVVCLKIYPETGRETSVWTEALEQYTGLKDKSGREIYEGDIVSTLDGFKPIVVYEDGGFYPFCIVGSECQDSPGDCEVIGNIHEKGVPHA